MNVLDRFLHYVSFETTSSEDSETCPSTPGQLTLGAAIAAELREMGLEDARQDEHGYVYATLPANTEKPCPVLGLIAHMDTSPDCSGRDIKPRILDYQGGDIVLSEEKNIVMKESEFPSLLRNRGKHLVVTDGSTLLGADDKAGVAEIITAAEELLHSQIPHGKIRLAFTPDEEIGRGPDRFDVKGFGADYAYTVDGGGLGELEYENFNGASARVRFRGVSIHPGSAKGKMINASLLAAEFIGLLPAEEIPAATEGYEGFFHLFGMKGGVEEAELDYIIRDHDRERFEQRKELFRKAAETISARWGEGSAEAQVEDSYYNMKEQILPHMYIIERARAAMEANGVTPLVQPIRGGTDGAQLSFMGLPCPNLFTGGENFHGRYEYVPVEDMECMVRVLKTLVSDLAK